MNFHSVDLSRWDYLVVDCGYVDRLVKKKDTIKFITTVEGDGDEADEIALMFFVDYTYTLGKAKYFMVPVQPDDDDVYDAIIKLTNAKKLHVRGAVCFKSTDCLNIDLVKMLVEYQHCGCFRNIPESVASFETKNGKKVLYKSFDTESG